jgi:hypothetical protein
MLKQSFFLQREVKNSTLGEKKGIIGMQEALSYETKAFSYATGITPGEVGTILTVYPFSSWELTSAP